MVTTIAYRNGVLCVDSQVTDRNRYEGSVIKWANGDGWVAAGAGSLSLISRALKTISVGDDGIPTLEFSILEDEEEIFVATSAGLFYSGKHGVSHWEADFYAAGSGGDIAIGAMAAGATAEEAVRIACKYDTKTCEPVYALTL
jgi:hypothetical protein